MTTNNNIKPTSSMVYSSAARDNEYENNDEVKGNTMQHDPADPENETDFKKAYLKLVKKVY